MNEYYGLMDNNKVNLAAASAILENNGESVLFRTFDDVLKITYRVRIAEELIKDEKDTTEKKRIIEDIEWIKNQARKKIRENKSFYASVITSKYAKDGEFEKTYERVKNAIESENEYGFYEWISLIRDSR